MAESFAEIAVRKTSWRFTREFALILWAGRQREESAAVFGACGAFTYQAAHFYEVGHYTLWYSLRVLFSFFCHPCRGNEISWRHVRRLRAQDPERARVPRTTRHFLHRQNWIHSQRWQWLGVADADILPIKRRMTWRDATAATFLVRICVISDFSCSFQFPIQFDSLPIWGNVRNETETPVWQWSIILIKKIL